MGQGTSFSRIGETEVMAINTGPRLAGVGQGDGGAKAGLRNRAPAGLCAVGALFGRIRKWQPRGQGLAQGHVDGEVWRWAGGTARASQATYCSQTPLTLTWGPKMAWPSLDKSKIL